MQKGTARVLFETALRDSGQPVCSYIGVESVDSQQAKGNSLKYEAHAAGQPIIIQHFARFSVTNVVTVPSAPLRSVVAVPQKIGWMGFGVDGGRRKRQGEAMLTKSGFGLDVD